MMKYKIILAVVFGLIFAVGCADKQEDANQLQEQMRQMEDGDSTTDTTAVVDSMTEQIAADANAIPVEEEEPARTMPQRPAGDGFAVQVASCEDEKYAMYMVDLFKERGYDPYVTSFRLDDQLFYRVRLGMFETRSEAQGFVDEMKDKYSIKAWIDSN